MWRHRGPALRTYQPRCAGPGRIMDSWLGSNFRHLADPLARRDLRRRLAGCSVIVLRFGGLGPDRARCKIHFGACGDLRSACPNGESRDPGFRGETHNFARPPHHSGTGRGHIGRKGPAGRHLTLADLELWLGAKTRQKGTTSPRSAVRTTMGGAGTSSDGPGVSSWFVGRTVIDRDTVRTARCRGEPVAAVTGRILNTSHVPGLRREGIPEVEVEVFRLVLLRRAGTLPYSMQTGT
jgi:hypothetical protein